MTGQPNALTEQEVNQRFADDYLALLEKYRQQGFEIRVGASVPLWVTDLLVARQHDPNIKIEVEFKAVKIPTP